MTILLEQKGVYVLRPQRVRTVEPAYDDGNDNDFTPTPNVFTEVNRVNRSSHRPATIIYSHVSTTTKKTVEKTLSSTTQHAKTSISVPSCQHYQVSFPAMNVLRRHEPVATDTVYADVSNSDGLWSHLDSSFGRPL
jgi:hypothetical protein